MNPKLLEWLTDRMVEGGVISNDPYQRANFRWKSEEALQMVLSAHKSEATKNYEKLVDELRDEKRKLSGLEYGYERAVKELWRTTKFLKEDRRAFYEAMDLLAVHEGFDPPGVKLSKAKKILRTIKARNEVKADE